MPVPWVRSESLGGGGERPCALLRKTSGALRPWGPHPQRPACVGCPSATVQGFPSPLRSPPGGEEAVIIQRWDKVSACQGPARKPTWHAFSAPPGPSGTSRFRGVKGSGVGLSAPDTWGQVVLCQAALCLQAGEQHPWPGVRVRVRIRAQPCVCVSQSACPSVSACVSACPSQTHLAPHRD